MENRKYQYIYKYLLFLSMLGILFIITGCEERTDQEKLSDHRIGTFQNNSDAETLCIPNHIALIIYDDNTFLIQDMKNPNTDNNGTYELLNDSSLILHIGTKRINLVYDNFKVYMPIIISETEVNLCVLEKISDLPVIRSQGDLED